MLNKLFSNSTSGCCDKNEKSAMEVETWLAELDRIDEWERQQAVIELRVGDFSPNEIYQKYAEILAVMDRVDQSTWVFDSEKKKIIASLSAGEMTPRAAERQLRFGDPEKPTASALNVLFVHATDVVAEVGSIVGRLSRRWELDRIQRYDRARQPTTPC